MTRRQILTACVLLALALVAFVVVPIALTAGGSPAGCEGDLWSDFRCFR